MPWHVPIVIDGQSRVPRHRAFSRLPNLKTRIATSANAATIR